MTNFRYALCALVLTLFSPLIPRVYADDVTAVLTVNGSLGVLVETDVAGVETFSYTNVFTDVFDTRATTFTAVYTDDLGVGLLSVTDLCEQVTVAFTSPVPCQALSFDFTDLTLLGANVLLDLGPTIDVLNNNVDFSFVGVGLAGGSGTVQFANPIPAPSSTPEPKSLALLLTGMFGVAVAARRKRRA